MAEVTYSPLGWFWVAIGLVWTIALVAAMFFLHSHRRLPFLQIRKLPLLFTAIVLLHIYAASCFPGLMIGTYITCDAQFWTMSIYLPFGMALLQATNSQFLHVASQQRQFANLATLSSAKLPEKATIIDDSLPWWARMAKKFQRLDKTTKIVVYISLAMVLELALTFLIYFGSAIFHPSYGIFHVTVPGTEAEIAKDCVTGWEWWLSIVWQFFWSWVYAPYLLWKSRNIRDTHGWRIQTIGCCIAGLPASPLWLASLYSPQMASANAVVPPPLWIGLSICVMEVFVIFLPCWHVLKTHNLQQETLDAIAAWEARNQTEDVAADEMSASSAGMGGRSTLGGSTIAEKRTSIAGKSARSKDTAITTSSRKSEMFTMMALENALRNNPQPLLEFAALKDFSGENVSFLTHVAEWKRGWASSKVDSETLRRQQFVQAVRIYTHFISLEYSEFPVNISSKGAKELWTVFDDAAKDLNRRRSESSDSAVPFDDSESEFPDTPSSTNTTFDLEGTLGKANLKSVARMAEIRKDGQLDIVVPDNFFPQIFDSAEGEIKYLVLTNTWPKFVHCGLETSSNSETLMGEKPGSIKLGAKRLMCGFR